MKLFKKLKYKLRRYKAYKKALYITRTLSKDYNLKDKHVQYIITAGMNTYHVVFTRKQIRNIKYNRQ